MKKKILAVTAIAIITSALYTPSQAGPLGEFKKAGRDVFGGVLAPAQQEALPPPTLRMGSTEQKQYDSANAYYGKTIVQGAAIGGLFGGIGCAIAGADEKVTALCAVGGGVIGGLLGREIAKKSKELIQDREKVDQSLVDARANRAAAMKLLAATEINIAYLEDQIIAYNAKFNAGTISQAQHRSEMTEAKRQLDDLNEGVETVKEQMDGQRKLFEKMEKRAKKSENPDVIAAGPAITKEKEDTESFIETEPVRVSARITVVQDQIG
jgi:uncharacterized protein YcfJ